MHNNKKQNSRIPEAVRNFANMTFEDYKKENKGFCRSKKEKKELKTWYFRDLTCDLPEVIDWCIRNGHIQDEKIQEVRNACYEKLCGENGPEYTKYLCDVLEGDTDDDKDIENIKLLPILLHEFIAEILKHNLENAENPAEQLLRPDDLYKLYETILKKRIKKGIEKGIPEDLLFDLLGIMPVKKAAEYSAYYRARCVFDLLYAYTKEHPMVSVEIIMDYLFYEDDMKYPIGYALQERRDKTKQFNEVQKGLYNSINGWAFGVLENMPKKEIRDILENYISVRKRDASQGKDSARRYYISSLPEKDYPTILKVVSQIKNADNEAEKYL